jgi:hypothetical protein
MSNRAAAYPTMQPGAGQAVSALTCQKMPLYSLRRFTNGLLALECHTYGKPVLQPSPRWSAMTCVLCSGVGRHAGGV